MVPADLPCRPRPQVHGLTRLRHLTETLLVGMVARSNCGMMLAQADKLKATELRKAAMQVILNEFDSLRPADLADVDSSLMAEIYRGRTNFPIHLAVTTGREVRGRAAAAAVRPAVADLPWPDSWCRAHGGCAGRRVPVPAGRGHAAPDRRPERRQYGRADAMEGLGARPVPLKRLARSSRGALPCCRQERAAAGAGAAQAEHRGRADRARRGSVAARSGRPPAAHLGDRAGRLVRRQLPAGARHRRRGVPADDRPAAHPRTRRAMRG